MSPQLVIWQSRSCTKLSMSRLPDLAERAFYHTYMQWVSYAFNIYCTHVPIIASLPTCHILSPP